MVEPDGRCRLGGLERADRLRRDLARRQPQGDELEAEPGKRVAALDGVAARGREPHQAIRRAGPAGERHELGRIHDLLRVARGVGDGPVEGPPAQAASASANAATPMLARAIARPSPGPRIVPAVD